MPRFRSSCACDQNIAVETLGQACLRGAATGRVDAGQRAAATDSEEAAAAAPRGDGLGGSGSSAIAASSQGQGSLWWLDAPVAHETHLGKVKCACSGHCYVRGHRYRYERYGHGCTSVDLLIGSRWCPACACAVSGCGRPRLRGPLCSAHKGGWEKGPLEFVLTRCAKKALP